MATLFFSYSHKDEGLRDALDIHLAVLKRQGVIETWHDRRITAGADFGHEISKNLEAAHVILLLISPDFLNSDYCYDREMARAMERHEAGQATVIPVILRPSDWKRTPFGKLQAVPIDGMPITRWADQDEAFLNVVTAIRKALKGRSSIDAATSASSRAQQTDLRTQAEAVAAKINLLGAKYPLMMPDHPNYRERGQKINELADDNYMREYAQSIATDAQRILMVADHRGLLAPNDRPYLLNSVVARRGIEEIGRIMMRTSLATELGKAPIETPNAPERFIDPAELAAIDEIYQALDEAEATYDYGCDVVGGPWRARILKIGPRAYAEEIANYRTDISNAIRKVADLCDKKHSRFLNIYKYRQAEFSFQNAVFEPINLFIEHGLSKLPAQCDETVLDLISDRAVNFTKGIAAFGTWTRRSKEQFRRMRN